MRSLIDLIKPTIEWADQAKCASPAYQPEWWWETDKHHPAALAAVSICESCPVRQPCLQYAQQADEREGTWGGLMPEHRARLRAGVA